MNKYAVEISPATENDIADLVLHLSALEGEPKIDLISSKGFGGATEVTLIISLLGSPIVVKSIAAVLTAWISRNEKKSVMLGKTKISGYSAEDVEKLLKKIKPK